MTNFYWAYPIDQAASNFNAAGLGNYITVLQHALVMADALDVSFDPGDAFSVRSGAPVTPFISDINTFAARAADVVIAVLPGGVPSIGVPIEIDRAARDGKVVAIITDVKAWMLSYDDKPWVKIFPITPASDDAALQAIVSWVDNTVAARARVLGGLLSDSQDPLPVQVLDGGRLPTRGHADDAGLDLYVTEDTVIPAGQFVDVPCGVAVELPDWSWGMLTGRSSTLRTKGLLVHTGVIDAGYRGPLFAGTWNQTDQEVWVKAGDRIAQLIVMGNLTRDLAPVEVESLAESARGNNGFGSTGR